MKQRRFTEFYVERLQPDWLAKRPNYLYQISFRLLIVVLIGLSFGLILGPLIGLIAGLLGGVLCGGIFIGLGNSQFIDLGQIQIDEFTHSFKSTLQRLGQAHLPMLSHAHHHHNPGIIITVCTFFSKSVLLPACFLKTISEQA